MTAAASRKGKPGLRPASRSKTVAKRSPAKPVAQPRKKTMSDPKKPVDAAADRNVDQIRDILFGG